MYITHTYFVYNLLKLCYTILVKIRANIFLLKGDFAMKKILSVVLAVIMTLSCMSVLAYAKNDVTPTIIIPGLFQSETYHYVNGEKECDANGVPLAGPFYVSISNELIGTAVTTALLPIATMFLTQQDKDQKAATAVANILSDILIGKQACDANGVQDSNVKAEYYAGPFSTLTDVQKEHVLKNFPVEEYFELAGEDYLYVFNYVSTGNMIQTANDLYDYIQFVKDYSGSDKVNIVPVSQGGSIFNALMKLYNEKGRLISKDINRIVFTVPALDGANLLGDAYKYGINDESEALYTTMFTSLLGENNVLSYVLALAVRLMPKTDVSNLLDVIADVLINKYLRYSTLMWGLIPSAYYNDSCRDMYLAGDDMAAIREQTDWYYDAQLNSDANILLAKLAGVEVFDIVDTNVQLYQLAATYRTTQADGIIQVDSTSMGAYSVNVGTKLPDDYKITRGNCWNTNHNHTDPEGIMDVRQGLLPDHTFYFSGQNHATTGYNDALMSLIINLLTDENFKDVFTYPDRFPQFNYSRETYQLRQDIKSLEEVDLSNISAADKQELDGALKQVDDMLAITVVNPAAAKAASDRFYAIYNKIMGIDSTDSSAILCASAKAISTALYTVYGDAAFSEMPMRTIQMIFPNGIAA